MNNHAVCILYERNGLVLAIGRKEGPNLIGLPGGKREKDEAFINAAHREFKEETGVVIPNKFNTLLPIFSDFIEETLVLAYRLLGDYLPKTQEGEQELLWVSWDDLCNPQRSPFWEYNTELRASLYP